MASKPKSKLREIETDASETEASKGDDSSRPTNSANTDASPPAHPTGPRRRRRGGSHEILPGERRVKGYPVTRDELFGLGGAGLLATVCFSVGGNMINRSLDIQKDLELAQELPKPIIARWETRQEDAWSFGILLLVIGAVAIAVGGAKIWSIIRSTEHPNG